MRQYSELFETNNIIYKQNEIETRKQERCLTDGLQTAFNISGKTATDTVTNLD